MQYHHNARCCWVHSTGCVTLTLFRVEDTLQREGLRHESPAKKGSGVSPPRTRVTVPPHIPHITEPRAPHPPGPTHGPSYPAASRSRKGR